MENRLRLSTITRLLPVIAALPLNRKAILTLLVLCNLVKRVLPTSLVLTERFLGLWHVHLYDNINGKSLTSNITELKQMKKIK